MKSSRHYLLASCLTGCNLLAAPGEVDMGFNPQVSGSNNRVNSMAVQPDGQILITGSFTTVNGQTRNGYGRLNADGSLESTASFNPGSGAANSPVNTYPYGIEVLSTAVQNDGQILLGGYFPAIDGQPRNRIARLNANGSVESSASFTIGSGIAGTPPWDGNLYAFAFQADGKILIGGDFTSVNGQPRRSIARLQSDGIVESLETFKIGDGVGGSNSSVTCLAVQPDGKILIGGGFTQVAGVERNYIARLNADGTVDDAFYIGTGADSTVWCILVQPDFDVIIGGDFRRFDGQPRNNLARLRPNGVLESAATFNVGSGPSGFVRSVALQADGRILIGGGFSQVNGQPRSGVARLEPNGEVESSNTFSIGSGAGGNNYVNGVALQSDGRILVCGEFTGMNGQPRNKIARLLNDPAVQSLSATSNSRLQWLRSGSAPEVSHVWFERSSDVGHSWSLIGSGARIPGGWESIGVNLSGTETVRARGRTSGGFANGSPGIVQSVTTLTPVADIAVEYPSGSSLQSGAAMLDFGPVVAGSNSSKLIVLRSTGTSILSGITLAQTVNGNPGDFSVSPPPSTSLPRGEEMTFTVAFSPGAPGNRNSTLLVLSNDPDESPFTIQLTGTQATPLEAWRQEHFNSPYSAGPGADLNDADGDGLVNLMEFATGGHPLQFSPPVGSVVKNGANLEFTYSRPKAALEDVSYRPEVSLSLSGVWSFVNVTSSIVSDDGVTQVVKVTAPSGLGKRFLRLRVTRL